MPECWQDSFDTANYVGANQLTGDAVHRYYQDHYQSDGGKMDKFVAWSDAAGLVTSYYDATNMPQGKLAQRFTMLDNFSMPNSAAHFSTTSF